MKIGLQIRALFTFIYVIFGKQKIRQISILQQLKFPLFISSFAFVLKITLCLLRKLRNKDDGYNAFLSGFIAGFTVLMNNDYTTRKMYALYLLSRAYAAAHTSLEQKKIIPKICKEQHIIFLSMGNILACYIFFCEFNSKVPLSYYGILNMLFGSFKEKNDKAILDIHKACCDVFRK